MTELALEVATALKARIVAEAAVGNAESAEKRQAKEREQAIETSRLRFKKQQVARDVAEMVESQGGSENLLTDLYERLDDPDIEDELLTIRVGDFIFGLCDHLDIPIDRSVWQDKGWYLNEDRPRPERPPPPVASSQRPGMPPHEWNRQRYLTPPDG